MSIHKKAIIVSLNISLPPQTRKERELSMDLAVRKRALVGKADVTKKLFPKSAIEPMRKAASRARVFLMDNTLPYGNVGLRLLPMNKYFDFMAKLSEHKDAFEEAKSKFITHYNEIIEQSKEELGDLFDPDDYPSVFDLDRRASFNLFTQTVPEVNAVDELAGLSDEERKEIKEQVEKEQAKALEGALQDLAGRVLEVLSKLALKLRVEDAVFRNSLVSNVTKTANLVESLNVTKNEKIASLVAEMRSLVLGVEPDSLRKDKVLRKKVSEEAIALVEKAQEFF